MIRLDPHSELTTPPEPKELPAPKEHEWLGAEHEPAWWIWILSLIVSSIATFSTTLALLARGTDVITVAFIGPVIFILVTFLAHAVVQRAR